VPGFNNTGLVIYTTLLDVTMFNCMIITLSTASVSVFLTLEGQRQEQVRYTQVATPEWRWTAAAVVMGLVVILELPLSPRSIPLVGWVHLS
jgi:hypothetical protein